MQPRGAPGQQPLAQRAHHVEQSAGQGDEEAVGVLLEAGRAAAPRAPGAATRWFEAALRLLPSGDTVSQVSVRVELASALRSVSSRRSSAGTRRRGSRSLVRRAS